MLVKQLHPVMLAATLLAMTSLPVSAQTGSTLDKPRSGDKAISADPGNKAWTKPEVESEPPSPNGGMSSGAHKGNESPTQAGKSEDGKNVSAESKKNLDRATSGSETVPK